MVTFQRPGTSPTTVGEKAPRYYILIRCDRVMGITRHRFGAKVTKLKGTLRKISKYKRVPVFGKASLLDAITRIINPKIHISDLPNNAVLLGVFNGYLVYIPRLGDS